MKIAIVDKYGDITFIELHDITDFKTFIYSIDWNHPVLVFNDVCLLTKDIRKIEVVK